MNAEPIFGTETLNVEIDTGGIKLAGGNVLVGPKKNSVDINSFLSIFFFGGIFFEQKRGAMWMVWRDESSQNVLQSTHFSFLGCLPVYTQLNGHQYDISFFFYLKSHLMCFNVGNFISDWKVESSQF